MTSRQTEDVHLTLLNKLLADSGIECLRPPPESSESTLTEGETEEYGTKIEEIESSEEAAFEEEDKIATPEQVQEELPEIFPTPSLRAVLSDRVRQIELQNRIHVLPLEFKTDIDPQYIPKIASTAQQKYIEIIADLVGCVKYRSSLAEYWFLDTMANLLRRAQEDKLDRPTQAILMLWFCEWMKEMQNFDVASRQRMMRRFRDNMLSAARFITRESHLPTPAEAGVYYKAQDHVEGSDIKVRSHGGQSSMSKHLVTFEGAAYECSIVDLTKIIHYIYDLFSTDYQYDLVRSVFTHTPDYSLIDAPYQVQNPKKLYVPIKVKPKKEGPKKADKAAAPQKGKRKDALPDPADYLALMELKAREEAYLEELEEIEREQWYRRSTILPLSMAAGDEFFNKYWPPPPPPEPEPEPEPKPKKGKK
ncbi:uncharacterized protein LOC142983384 [Anticarsia gemmatalis]|uniref:uncharacterized protein LOC142983384 n=1 Tax=Anticarsia gemmatalis TaxID=129554 RepID=UPI003F764F13